MALSTELICLVYHWILCRGKRRIFKLTHLELNVIIKNLTILNYKIR